MKDKAVCRKCHTALSGNTYLQISYKTHLDGGQKLCLICLDRLMEKAGKTSVQEFVLAYIKENKPDTVQTLKKRVEELERLLEGMTKP